MGQLQSIHSPVSRQLSFGQARNKYGPVPALSRKRRKQLLAFLCVVRRRVLEILRRVRRSVSDWFAEGGSGYDQLATLQWPRKPAIDTSPLVEASKRKETAAMVLEYATPAIQPPAPVLPPNGAYRREWTGKSTTPGIPTTIDLGETARILSAARVNHPEWLIGSSKRHSAGGGAVAL